MCCCGNGYCAKCNGGCLLVVGLIILANQYWNLISWWTLLGALIAIGGFMKIIMPMCPCKKEEMKHEAKKK